MRKILSLRKKLFFSIVLIIFTSTVIFSLFSMYGASFIVIPNEEMELQAINPRTAFASNDFKFQLFDLYLFS